MFSEVAGHSGLVSASIFPRKSRVKGVSGESLIQYSLETGCIL